MRAFDGRGRRYAQCDDTCTVDCGACKGRGRPEPLHYDADLGHVVTATYLDGAIREAIEVRRGLEDAAVLEAVVAELRRRGFTVTPPGQGP